MTTELHHYTREDQRRELLSLAHGLLRGDIRQEIAHSLVPLTASEFCGDALGTFSDLLVALRCKDGPEVTRTLNALCGTA